MGAPIVEMTFSPQSFREKSGSYGSPRPSNNTFSNSQHGIYELMNTIEYFLNAVWIEQKNNRFRLVVISQNRVLTDRVYATLLGAKVAFARRYNSKAWKLGVKARWLDHQKEFPERDS